MDHWWKQALEIVYPALSVWSVAAYLHFLHLLTVFDRLRSWIALSILFIPALAMEAFFSSHFPLSDAGGACFLTDTAVLADGGLWLRWGFWFVFFLVWVLFMGVLARVAVVVKFFITEFYFQLYLLYRAQRWLTVLAAMTWAAAYGAITLHLQTGRVFTGIVLPGMLTVALLFHLYRYGGWGKCTAARIEKQEGVAVPMVLHSAGPFRIPQHPRGIYFDGDKNALYALFGATYGPSGDYPSIVRKDLDSGRLHAFMSRNVRRAAVDWRKRHIYVAPWYQKVIYKLALDDLAIRATWPNQTEGLLQTWEPMDVMKDIAADRIYVGNDADQALIAYNSETGRKEGMLDLVKEGLVRAGGPVWHIRQSAETRKIYFITGPGHHLFEVDPDTLAVLRYRSLNDVVGTALVLDDANQRMFYQNGTVNALYEIDMETFHIHRTLKGEGHARRLLLDPDRNCIYVLGYLSGTVFALDLMTGARQWTRKVGGLPHGMDLVGDTLWVNGMSGVVTVDLNTVGAKEGHRG